MTTGETGMVNQVNGLAEALGLPFEMKTVHPAAPWRGLPGHWAASVGALASTPFADGVHAPWPDLLITCGRRSAALAIAIKRASGGRTFTVHIQNPRVPPRYFDLIAAPEHDRLAGPNVISTRGALHRLTRETLASAGARFRERFAALRRPMAAVLVGGKSRSHRLTPERARELASQLRELVDRRDVGLAVTASRRTGPENAAILREALAGSGAFMWDGEGENPYFAMLALADWIIVTEDSASMVSEACFTGKPVHVAAVEGGARRFKRMHRRFREAGFTRPFTGELESWSYDPLDETRRVAALVAERLERRRECWQARLRNKRG
jgi:mitochondrial fission protein ELM1